MAGPMLFGRTGSRITIEDGRKRIARGFARTLWQASRGHAATARATAVARGRDQPVAFVGATQEGARAGAMAATFSRPEGFVRELQAYLAEAARLNAVMEGIIAEIAALRFSASPMQLGDARIGRKAAAIERDTVSRCLVPAFDGLVSLKIARPFETDGTTVRWKTAFA